MAEEVLIVTWCDPCHGDGSKTEGEAYTLNGIRVDLCPEHARPVREALEIAKTWGRKRPPTNDAARIPCPDCDKTYGNSKSLSDHRRHVHGLTRSPAPAPAIAHTKVDRRHQPMDCPECGNEYIGAQGLASHRRIVHGVPGVSKADLDHIATGRIRTA